MIGLLINPSFYLRLIIICITLLRNSLESKEISALVITVIAIFLYFTYENNNIEYNFMNKIDNNEIKLTHQITLFDLQFSLC